MLENQPTIPYNTSMKEKPKTKARSNGKHPGGRPPKPKEDILAVFALMAQGMSIRKACTKIGMSDSTFMDYIARPEFSAQYAQAMERRADALFDEIVDIADNNEPEADTNRDRLRVDTRKWIVARMLPKKYGDKVDGDGLADNKLEIVITDKRT